MHISLHYFKCTGLKSQNSSHLYSVFRHFFNWHSSAAAAATLNVTFLPSLMFYNPRTSRINWSSMLLKQWTESHAGQKWGCQFRCYCCHYSVDWSHSSTIETTQMHDTNSQEKQSRRVCFAWDTSYIALKTRNIRRSRSLTETLFNYRTLVCTLSATCNTEVQKQNSHWWVRNPCRKSSAAVFCTVNKHVTLTLNTDRGELEGSSGGKK